ncbi:MAG TPA: dethiobiotin synthase [Xanthobacteraceae bacterium]|jgi:dethiobiotin synthetase
MSAFFVTGIGTEVGKTFVTAGLVRQLRARGREVQALKPVVSGFDPAAPTESDPGLLLAALDRPIIPVEIERIAPWRFAAPLSPDMAATREGRAIDFAALIEFSRSQIVQTPGTLLIEGAGGIMAPLDRQYTMLDWMSALRLPLVVVAGSYLGSISHTLTCLDVLQRRDLQVAALMVSESERSTVPFDENVSSIARFADPLTVIGLPRVGRDADAQPVFAQLADLLTSATA